MIQQVEVSNSDFCPVCHGTGFELFNPGEIEGYGIPQDFAKPCPKCKGRDEIDRTGAPYKATLDEFGFDSYSRDMGNLRKISTDFLQNFRTRWQAAGKGLYIWGRTPGSGKTLFSCALARSTMMKNNLRFRFVTAPDYLARVGESYKRERGAFDDSQVYRECELLVFDDLGAQKSGEWQDQEIFRLVNGRLNAGKVTLFTSNLSPDSLNLDNRTIDRIVKTSVVLQMPEESIRKKLAQEEQDAFLSEIMNKGLTSTAH